MRTQTLFEVVAQQHRRFGTPTHVPVVDLYCGIGGFSTGAAAAGHSVAVAVDSSPEALTWHSHNHPEADHYGYAIPDTRLRSRLPPPGTLYHLHGSPPCTLVSQAWLKRCSDRWSEGVAGVRAYLQLARELDPASFTMEQVDNVAVKAVIAEFMVAHPGWIDYTVVHMEQYGVPQARRRVIAGSPWMIQRLRDTRSIFGRPRARDACPSIPKAAVGIKGMSTGISKKARVRGPCVSQPAFSQPRKDIDMARRAKKGGLGAPAPTVMALNKLRWTSAAGSTLSYLTVRQHADFQTFPADYRFPDDNRLAQQLCGNAVPPMFAQHLMSNYRLPIERDGLPPPTFPARPLSPCAASA